MSFQDRYHPSLSHSYNNAENPLEKSTKQGIAVVIITDKDRRHSNN